VLTALSAKVMIPMHFFGQSTLDRFLERASRQSWKVERQASPTLTVSRATLPGTPTVIALPGR
jgi:hypothetical protein